MYEYEVIKVTDNITCLKDATDVACFLVTGKERAMLIDTGVGLKGLKEKVEELTSLPYDVALTHGHGDHGAGVSVFDGAYIFPVDIPMAIEHTKEMRYSYTNMMFVNVARDWGGPEREPATKDDFVPETADDYPFKTLFDGMEFDLGGVTVLTIAVPGHTKGSCCFLVKEDRHILFGDACNFNTLVGGPESTSISEYKKSLLYLKSFEKDFDTVMYSHGPATGVSTLDDNIELCERILAGTDDKEDAMGFSGPGYYAAAKVPGGFMRVDGKDGNIFYSDLTVR